LLKLGNEAALRNKEKKGLNIKRNRRKSNCASITNSEK
jgi:hypothetical protein